MSETRASAAEPTPAAVSFVTTEHFTLQGARSQATSEATGRVSIFLAAVSGGLVALGLTAAAADIGTAFYALALTLLPTLAFIGFVTWPTTRWPARSRRAAPSPSRRSAA